MKQRIQFCTSRDGVRIAFATAGQGPPLVRVNNWFTHLEIDWDSPVWRHWLEAFVERRMLIRYDPRGSGLSDRDAADFSLDAWVADLEAVVDAIGLRRFPLVGLCQGGLVAIAYAARHPDRVSRLVLYSSYLHGAYVGGAEDKFTKQAQALSQMIEIGWPRGRGVPRGFCQPPDTGGRQGAAEMDWRAAAAQRVAGDGLPAVECLSRVRHTRRGCQRHHADTGVSRSRGCHGAVRGGPPIGGDDPERALRAARKQKPYSAAA
jgi:pimeloyl-ACP methyl ester carboxylesterase